MILGVVGYLMEATAHLRGRSKDAGAATIGRELRDLERGFSRAPPRDTARGGAPRTDPR
jgi:hypothetical protein